MPRVNVILKDSSGTTITVEGADRAGWSLEHLFPGATQKTVMLVCKDGDTIVARFKSEEVVGFALNTAGDTSDSASGL